MADIFISYKREDRALAIALSAYLEGQGYTVWWDAQVVAGQGFSRAIRAQIDAAAALIVIWTPASIHSEYVEAEANHARADDKAISVRTDETKTRDLPFPFPQRHCDLLSDRPAILRALEYLKVPRSAENAPAPAPGRREIPTLQVDPFPGRGDFTSIQAAVDAAPDGACILIAEGVYREAVIIRKPIELRGQGARENIRIVAAAGDALHLETPFARVSGLTLRREEGGTDYAVWITEGAPELIDCDISSLTLAGIAVKGPAAPFIRRCAIRDGKEGGVFVHDQGAGLIEDCEIHGNARAGVEIKTGSAPKLERCTISKNGYEAIWVRDQQSSATIIDCDLRGNAKGAWDIAKADKTNIVDRGNKT